MTPHEEFISKKESEISEVISTWIPENSPQFSEKIIASKKWFDNFKPSELSLALTLLKKIQLISDHDIRGHIEASAKHLKKMFHGDMGSTLFYPLEGSSASSGSQFLYEYGKELGLKDDNFKSDDFNTHLNREIDIVFFDDIIGSGNQATKFFNQHLKGVKAKCHYIALLGFEDGIQKIKKDASFESLLVCKHLSDEQMAFSDNSFVFKKSKKKSEVKALCLKYGKELYPNHPLGYDNSQALIVLPYNTPNNTLPVIWAGSKSESEPTANRVWYPIWPRKKRLKPKKKA